MRLLSSEAAEKERQRCGQKERAAAVFAESKCQKEHADTCGRGLRLFGDGDPSCMCGHRRFLHNFTLCRCRGDRYVGNSLKTAWQRRKVIKPQLVPFEWTHQWFRWCQRNSVSEITNPPTQPPAWSSSLPPPASCSWQQVSLPIPSRPLRSSPAPLPSASSPTPSRACSSRYGLSRP